MEAISKLLKVGRKICPRCNKAIVNFADTKILEPYPYQDYLTAKTLFCPDSVDWTRRDNG